MSEAVDVEHLLRWAYRDELSKRVTSSSEAVWGRFSDLSVYGTSVDYSSGPQRYDLGSPHPDALLIEQQVGNIPDVALDWQREAPMILGGLIALVDPRAPENAPAPSATAIGWYGQNGQIVRQRVAGVRQVFLVRTLRPSALVTVHANAGTRPNWMYEYPRPQPVPSVRGVGPKIVGECRGRNYYTTGSYCPLTWDPSPIEIAEVRADYLAWWRGLVWLADRLNLVTLSRFHVKRPAVAEMPWRIMETNAPAG